MCGIAGFMTPESHFSSVEAQRFLTNMSDAIIHRGPDDGGSWSDSEAGIWLGHRRLAIVFNGEIYNHLDLRKQLSVDSRKRQWKGHSDTETLLACFEAWGIEQTLAKTVGMFALALWDKQKRKLYLARDRLGEKPLYYGWQGQGNGAVFLFGSELKALRAHQAFESKIDRNALCLQLRHNYIPAPYSIYKGISKLLPGKLLTVSLQQREPKVWTYWSGAKVAQSGAANIFIGSENQTIDELERLLMDAVHKQVMADVPLGAFLSGGVDSSAIVALMQAQSSQPVKTFTIGFNEEGYNEAVHAKAVAKHLGTNHTELYVTDEQVRAVIPLLATLYDEPFSDSSQIPTFLVSQLARQHVTVSLSGDAGDELFCDKLHKGAEVLLSRSVDELYRGLVSHWRDPSSVVIGGIEPPTLLTDNAPDFSGLDNVQRMMAFDMLTYLPDDILTKVDRAAMGTSLETRVPFLDHRVVKFAWGLQQSMKLRDGQTKWALRQVLYRHVPKALIERPKMGFGVPIDSWLRGPLRDWAEGLLNEERLKHEGFFNPLPIRKKWTEHLSGQRNWQYHLWDVLMFQAWLEKNK